MTDIIEVDIALLKEAPVSADPDDLGLSTALQIPIGGRSRVP